MAVEIVMPKLGMTMEEGKLIEWAKSEKDSVVKGEHLLVIETDKVSFEVPAPGDGLLLILLKDGDNIAVGTLLGYLADSDTEYQQIKAGKGADPDALSRNDGVALPEADAMAARDVRRQGERVRAAPAARRLAEKAGVDLTAVAGTGPAGRVTQEDVRKVVDAGAENRNPAPAGKQRITPGARRLAQEMGIDICVLQGTGPNGRIIRDDVIARARTNPAVPCGASTAAESAPAQFKGKRILRVEPMSGIRATIARRMMESLQNAAQMTAFGEWDMTELMALRKILNRNAETQGYKFSIPGLMVFFLARVLREIPVFNASVDGNTIKYWQDVNVGVAVAVDDALVVPVVHNAQCKSLPQIQADLADLIVRARSKKLQLDDMSGGTFTLSNVGSYGSDWETVILNPPEAGLLGIGRIVEKPVVINGEILVRKVMPISLTFDHRIIDGAKAGEFRTRMKALVENPGLMLACMGAGV